MERWVVIEGSPVQRFRGSVLATGVTRQPQRAVARRLPLPKDARAIVFRKQENRELYQDAHALRGLEVPQILQGAGKSRWIWDWEGLF